MGAFTFFKVYIWYQIAQNIQGFTQARFAITIFYLRLSLLRVAVSFD